MGLRDGRTGLAPLGAVLSFLRQEGQPVYDDIMTRAGAPPPSGIWRPDRLVPPVTRVLPTRLRGRYALARSRRLVRAAFDPARARVGGPPRVTATSTIDGSVFCDAARAVAVADVHATSPRRSGGISSSAGRRGRARSTQCRAHGQPARAGSTSRSRAGRAGGEEA